MRSCARRSLAAATSFMARVIFWVDSTERIRRRMSRSVAMTARRLSGGLDAPAHLELRLGVVDGLGQRLAELVAELLLVRDLGHERGVLPVHDRIHEFLEGQDLVDGEIVEQPLRPREDDDDLA